VTRKQRRILRAHLASLAIATMSPADRVAALHAELAELEASSIEMNAQRAERRDEIVAGIARIKGEEPPR
jgi:hypothetical protein